jgi:ATP-binding cassette subfamily G (WHITE) protein 2 (SNQ2)
MLEVIGAGATAKSEIDWYNVVWMRSSEYKALLNEIDNIHSSGRDCPSVTTERRSEFSTSWMNQMITLLLRDLQVHWRDPTYMISKIMLAIVSGLFFGFSFWKTKDTIQGTQNKLFAIFSTMLLSFSLALQLQVPFINMRTIYEIRERPSRMYSFTALLTSQILAELPFNALASALMLFILFWLVGFASNRMGYTYLVMGVFYPIYFTTIGQAIAGMAPEANLAGILLGVLFSFVIML